MHALHPRRIRRAALAMLTTGATLLVVAALIPTSAHAAACTKTMTGTNRGVINVAGGQKLCMRGVTQTGAVNVAPGGGLSVTKSSTITGAITLKSGYTEFIFCGSKTIRGAISATGGKSAVLIGGDVAGATACPANTIGGAVTLNANKKGVTLGRNKIAGAVTASANLGDPLVSGSGTLITGNMIGGALTCTTNAPAPTNGDVPNVVGGGRSGQTCSVLTF